jgi:hypothetical protein
MFCSAITKTMVARPLLSWRHLLRTQTKCLFSSSVISPPKMVTKLEEPLENATVNKSKRSSSMITAAFQSLNEVDGVETDKVLSLDDRISSADSIDALLSVAESSNVTKKHALKIVSVLAEWSSEKKAKINDFESDARFNKLCRMLGHTYNKNKSKDPKIEEESSSKDLAMVLEVTGDDEAAKLVSSISLPQMIKVIIALNSEVSVYAIYIHESVKNIPWRMNII